MDKLLCRNNLILIGKWAAASFMFGIAVVALTYGKNFPLRAYVSEIIPSNSFEQIKFNLNDNPTEKINEITKPINDMVGGLLNDLRVGPKINLGTGTPLSPLKTPSLSEFNVKEFFGSSRVSSNDLVSFLREAAVTGINLTLVVFSVTTQILKVLLDVLR